MFYTCKDYFSFPWKYNCKDERGQVVKCEFTVVMYILAVIASWSPIIVVLFFPIYNGIRFWRIRRVSLIILILTYANFLASYGVDCTGTTLAFILSPKT